MPRFSPTTKSGHSLFTMRSLLQKAIRRADLDHAGYAANEMFEGYHSYLWKTLLTISAEDCYGVITKEIVALYQADEIKNKGKKGGDRDCIFVAKALVLLCMARKNRDGCYVACNFMLSDRELDIGEIPGPDELEHYAKEYGRFMKIPEYTYDNHTIEGRKAGKTDLDMTIDEEAALTPHQYSLFDGASWENYYNHEIRQGHIGPKEQREIKKFQQGKVSDPTFRGTRWPTDRTDE